MWRGLGRVHGEKAGHGAEVGASHRAGHEEWKMGKGVTGAVLVAMRVASG